MRTLAEIKADLGEPELIEPIFGYYAYKNGKGSLHTTEEIARAHSNLIERVLLNQSEINKNNKEWKEFDAQVQTQWESEIRCECPYLTDRKWQVVVEFTREQNPGASYDYLAEQIQINAQFALKLHKSGLK